MRQVTVLLTVAVSSLVEILRGNGESYCLSHKFVTSLHCEGYMCLRNYNTQSALTFMHHASYI